MPLYAEDLERLHGSELARPPLSEAKSPYLLYKALQDRRPAIDTTKQTVKTEIAKYRRAPDEAGERVVSAEERSFMIRTMNATYYTLFLSILRLP